VTQVDTAATGDEEAMAEPTDSSSPQQNGNDSGGADDKPRLTEEEKKQNHIASGMSRPGNMSPFPSLPPSPSGT